jgi:hypothetical protein
MIEGGVQALDLDCVDVIEASHFALEIRRYTLTFRLPGAKWVKLNKRGNCFMKSVGSFPL